MNNHLTNDSHYGTLSESDAESEGKSRPPWAEHNFSHAFTGLPPVNCYKDLLERFETAEDDVL